MATKAVVVVRDARMIHSVMPARDEFKNLFPSWIKPHDGGFKLQPIPITVEDLQAIHDIEFGVELDPKTFKPLGAITSTEQPESLSNGDLDDAPIREPSSERILRFTAVEAFPRSTGPSNFAVEISVPFLQETLNTVKRGRGRLRKERRALVAHLKRAIKASGRTKQVRSQFWAFVAR